VRRDFLPKDDATLRQIVGRHLHVDAVANDGADAETPHLAGGVGDDAMLVVELNPETAVRVDFVDDAFDGEHFFLCQDHTGNRLRAHASFGSLSATRSRLGKRATPEMRGSSLLETRRSFGGSL
jgi:hypothetical protein